MNVNFNTARGPNLSLEQMPTIASLLLLYLIVITFDVLPKV
jgi:hypothetical protein